MAKSFRELDIYKEGLELLLMVYQITKKYPPEEKFDLTSQTKRSSNSIIAQIAEAHGRFFYADKARVLYQSRGELEETRSHLLVAKELGYLDPILYEEMDSRYESLSKGISSYANYFERQKERKITKS